ncbi:MAG: hypothetical protein JWL61_1734 [Gemmatimonadetes bacterium]|nr:hypothetical protein [Gemmatimonadota bacterium]
MGRKIGGAALLLLSALMLLGFARSGASIGSPTTLFAVLITVVLPAAGGVALLRGALGGNSRARMQQLRQQTIDAEILRLAMARQGKLTAVEVASALALPESEARSSLDSLVTREVADLDVTDEGVLVYSFHEARYFDGNSGGKLLGG